jgi:hypothetical protein
MPSNWMCSTCARAGAAWAPRARLRPGRPRGAGEARQHAAPRILLSVTWLPARLKACLPWTAAGPGSGSRGCSRSRTASAGLTVAGACATPGPGAGGPPLAQRAAPSGTIQRVYGAHAPRQSPPRPTGPRRPGRRRAARPRTPLCRSRLPPVQHATILPPAATSAGRCADAAFSRRTHLPHARTAAASASRAHGRTKAHQWPLVSRRPNDAPRMRHKRVYTRRI